VDRMDQLASMYAYHFDTALQLLSLAEQAPVQMVNEARAPAARSIPDLFFHILDTDRAWRIGLETGTRPERLRGDHYPTLSALREGLEQERRAWELFLANLEQAQLDREIALGSEPGRFFAIGRWKVVHHVLLHGMQHLSEAAAKLTEMGASPGDIDFIFYSPADGHGR
jgi:uncharacterized damage-inducible protein DinB